MEFLIGLAGPFIKEIILGGIGVLAVAVFGWRQKRKGRAEILEANRRARVEARETRSEIDRAVAGDDDESIREDLSGWEK